MKLRTKLLFVFIIVFLIVSSISIISYFLFRETIRHDVKRQLYSYSQFNKQLFKNIIEGNHQKIALIASRTQLRNSLDELNRKQNINENKNKINKIIKDAQEAVKDFKSISVLNLNGSVIASTDTNLVNYNYKNEEYFILGKKGKTNKIFFVNKTKSLQFISSAPLILNDRIIGVILIVESNKKILHFLSTMYSPQSYGNIEFMKKIDDENYFLATNNDITGELSYGYFSYNELGAVEKQCLYKKEIFIDAAVNIDNNRTIACSEYIDKLDVYLIASYNYKKAFYEVTRLRNILIFFDLLILLIIFFVLFVFKRTVTNPIEKLTNASVEISKGNFDQIINVKTNDEIGILANSFDIMKNELKYTIDKYKLAEVKLKEEKDNYYRIFENTGAATVILGEDRTILMCNKGFEKISGFSKQEIEGKKKWTEFVCVEDLERMKKYHSDRRTIGKSVPEEYEFNFIDRNKNNKNVYIQITTFKNLKQSVASLIDITAMKQAQDAVVESEQRFKAILKAAHNVAFVLTDVSGKDSKIIEFSSGAENIFGYKKEEVLGKPVSIFYLNEDVEKFPDIINNLDEEKSFSSEMTLVRKSGERFQALFTVYPIFDNNKKMIYVLGISTDITEQKKTEKALKKSELNFSLFMDNIPASVYIKDSELKTIYVNKQMKDYFMPDNWMGKNAVEIFGSKTSEIMLEDDKKVFQEGHISRIEKVLDKKGEEHYYHTLKFPIALEGESPLLGGISWDISEQIKAENELRDYKNNLEKIVEQRTKDLNDKTKALEKSQLSLTYLVEDVNASRRELEKLNKKLISSNQDLESFAYSVSHDLRAPLRAIEGFSDIIQEDYAKILGDEGKHYFDRIKFNINRMSKLIDDMLMLSRVGRREIKPKDINIKTIAFEVFNSMEDEFKNRKIDFVLSDCPDVYADPDLIRILLENLISNSVKFTKNRKKSKIEIGCMMKDNKTVFFVKDNGVGFDMKYADKLFAPFQRLHSVKDFKGTGIGLSIVKRIITKHNGQIWAESILNKKTIFYFTLND
ncbi:MAG: PAS domain S-box protein [Bacteroidales bacterium]|nr:PAS domain S-box protein [Bacteroidales bacterium]